MGVCLEWWNLLTSIWSKWQSSVRIAKCRDGGTGELGKIFKCRTWETVYSIRILDPGPGRGSLTPQNDAVLQDCDMALDDKWEGDVRCTYPNADVITNVRLNFKCVLRVLCWLLHDSQDHTIHQTFNRDPIHQRRSSSHFFLQSTIMRDSDMVIYDLNNRMDKLITYQDSGQYRYTTLRTTS